jgi:diguanylate cyclase (GGDEF)-like protein
MMPEHDPRSARPHDADGSEAPTSRAPGPDPAQDDGVVQLAPRARGELDDADRSGPDPDDTTVVDLRRSAIPSTTPSTASPEATAAAAMPSASSPPPPPEERRTPEVVAHAPTTIDEPALSPLADGAPSTLSARVIRAVAPVAVVLVIAGALCGVGALRASSLHRSAASWDSVAAAQERRTAAIERAWAATLATVAAGVGQSVSSVDALPELLAEVSATDVGPSSPTDAAATDRDRAERTASAFVDDLSAALDRAAGSPLELGNELEQLDAAQQEAVDASTAFAERASQLAEDDRDRAGTLVALAVLALLVGLVAAGVVAAAARRRLQRGLDGAVSDLHRSIGQVGAEHPGAPVEVRGFAEMAWLGAELRRRAAEDRQRLAALRRRAEWGERSRRIFEALDLAEDEASTYEVLDRALAVVGGERRVELLLSERGSTRLQQVAANPNAAAPGCPVDITGSCVALRRGQVSVFDSSESINACPKLRDRPDGPCSAACVPVTIAGRPVGVLHMTSTDGEAPSADVVDQLVGLATQTGTRFSALRTLESSRHEASTDGLTGLPNRRILEAQMGELFDRDTPFVVVLADLDRFKLLNDNFGHEMGDKALQLFAGVLRDNVRGNDVVARLGGEEFVLVYPNMSVEISLEAIDRVRAALARALDASPVPPFTCSFGIAHSSVGHDGDTVLRVADAGMLRAKDLGGDQAVVADADLAASIFTGDAPLRARRERPS